MIFAWAVTHLLVHMEIATELEFKRVPEIRETLIRLTFGPNRVRQISRHRNHQVQVQSMLRTPPL
jgi:hypothetical protein